MEFRITELLDGVDASRVPIEPAKAASKSRVEKLVFDKIAAQGTKKAARRSFRVWPLAAALAALLSLSIMAGASEIRAADLFGSFFGLLSQGQKDAVEELAMTQPVSVSAKGTTVTLATAIGDDHSCYLKLQIHAPEGKVLSVPDKDRGELTIVDRDHYEAPHSVRLLSDQQGGYIQYDHSVTWIDPVPGDNQLEMILQLSLPMDSPVSFIDDEPEILTVPGLWMRTLSMEYTGILEGPWTIELGKCGGQLRELEVQGKTATYTADGKTVTLSLESIKMSQLGLEVRGTFLGNTEGTAIYSYPMPMVVLKDRSIFASGLYAGNGNDGFNGRLNESSCVFAVKFDAPLDMDQVDHLRLGDLVIPFWEGASYVEGGAATFVQGTHITLGEPDSLRSSGKIADLADIGVHGAGSITFEAWRNAWTYAAHTDEGVQLAHIESEFESGKLVYTVTCADVITDLRDLNTKADGFSREACLVLDSNNEWQKQERPGCIREDGSFEEGWYLVVLNMTVRNDNAAASGEMPYLFDAGRLLTLADLRYKTAGNYRAQYIDYFSGTDSTASRELGFTVKPGEETCITVGWLVSGNVDFTALRACTTTGGEQSTFVNLKLEEKTAQ